MLHRKERGEKSVRDNRQISRAKEQVSERELVTKPSRRTIERRNARVKAERASHATRDS